MPVLCVVCVGVCVVCVVCVFLVLVIRTCTKHQGLTYANCCWSSPVLVAICGPVARGNSLCAANAGHGT